MSADDIYQDLRARILRRDDGHRPGDRLPKQEELADLYAVSVATVQRAVRLLKHDGLVRTRGGAGTVVVGVPDADAPAEDYLADHS